MAPGARGIGLAAAAATTEGDEVVAAKNKDTNNAPARLETHSEREACPESRRKKTLANLERGSSLRTGGGCGGVLGEGEKGGVGGEGLGGIGGAHGGGGGGGRGGGGGLGGGGGGGGDGGEKGG
eukprot:2882845-Pleurochrysis_carterae.AAC.6